MELYIVRPGDTVDSIARETGTPVDSLIYANQLPYPYRLAVGQALLLSIGPSRNTGRSVAAAGYAYPFISRYVLEETLPYLTELPVFSYGFTADGVLVPPLLPDAPLIEAALAQNVNPILTLTPFGPDGQFSNYLITQLINNPAATRQLIRELTALLPEKGYRGVDIDFEFILAEDREAFAAFTAAVRQAVNALGYPVSVALAPKTSDDQQGLLYQGKDYGLLGEAADFALLMTYEWGYTYGPPMAVAPLDKVRQVVEYAVTRIAPGKLSLGIPNYGYDWTLPYVRGQSKARTIGNVEAVQIAIQNNAVIQFDETAQSPYFTYTAEGRSHEVWFEDVRSLAAKFALIPEYGLRGAGYWQIMQLFRANWLLLADTFWIRKT
ncbi:MAG: LysM peptidoglycan-binding domain-containing protein [Lachnospiraceae bacterium]|nr:LysM peptidoglycan-binding domain-containing protein [Lachnospiraceae bacterium]MCI9150385.1 LysM peptidoglycan-binding domain-containing protein [Lachnospiraceae bacterium]